MGLPCAHACNLTTLSSESSSLCTTCCLTRNTLTMHDLIEAALHPLRPRTRPAVAALDAAVGRRGPLSSNASRHGKHGSFHPSYNQANTCSPSPGASEEYRWCLRPWAPGMHRSPTERRGGHDKDWCERRALSSHYPKFHLFPQCCTDASPCGYKGDIGVAQCCYKSKPLCVQSLGSRDAPFPRASGAPTCFNSVARMQTAAVR